MASDDQRNRKEARESIQHAIDHLEAERAEHMVSEHGRMLICQRKVCLAIGDLKYAKERLR